MIGRAFRVIREAKKADGEILAELALQLWPDHSLRSLREEFEELAEGEDSACFLRYAGGKPVGFAQCQLRRDYVDDASGLVERTLDGHIRAYIRIPDGYRYGI